MGGARDGGTTHTPGGNDPHTWGERPTHRGLETMLAVGSLYAFLGSSILSGDVVAMPF